MEEMSTHATLHIKWKKGLVTREVFDAHKAGFHGSGA